jgi:serine/threonine-protein kinase
MGAVFEVVHLETQRRRALKVMLPEFLANRQLRERFQMEARITANVDSEYIVDVFDAGIDDATGMPFLVMELLNGEDLAKVLERNGRLTAEQVVSYLRQVASALDKTHAAGIVHRDLKPENLFLTHREDGTPRVKILDFGISKVVTEASTGANATRGLGTPLYMAPEQVLAQTVGPATDLYALGLIAYTLLVGVAYWQREAETFDNPITFVVHTSKGATDSALARAAQAGHLLPPAFDAWFRRATNLDSASRFRSAAELVRELAAALGVAAHIAMPFGPDSTGSVGRVGPGSSVETMVARTAPGTELDRPSTLSGGARRTKNALWLGLVVVGLALAGVATAALLRARTLAASAAAEVKSSAANPVTGSASVTVRALAPLSSESAVASAAAPAQSQALPQPPAASASKASAKSPTVPHKLAPAKAAAGSAPAAPPPKYTRD